MIPADQSAGRFGQIRRRSAYPSALSISTRRAEDLFAGWWPLISALAGAASAGLETVKGRPAGGGGRSELTSDCQGFRCVLRTRVILLRRRNPEHKGIIERAATIWSGRSCPASSLLGPVHFNKQLQNWLQTVNARSRQALSWHRPTGWPRTDSYVADWLAL